MAKRILILLLALAACSVQRISKDIYERQQELAALESEGRSDAAAEQRRRIAKQQAKLQRIESNVPAFHYDN